MSPLLSVENLGVALARADGSKLPILHDVGFNLAKGETLGIVGESGSGKSLLALALIGLLPGSATVSGAIRFEGRDLVTASEAGLSAIRGRRIAMIFQEPMTALNPAMRIGDQIAEGLRLDGVRPAAARAAALALLDRVRIADAANRIDAFPHELSGGQRQRVVIAIALARSPALLIADEPTTALDVTVQRDVLDILGELVAEANMALILVSHDLGVIARTVARTLVLYAGTRFEEAPTAALLATPANPYTRGLIGAMPRPRKTDGVRQRLTVIPGTVPAFGALPPGCRFADRCPAHIPACDAGEPPWRAIGPDRAVRCIRATAEGAER
ncbi:ABC transporter ATP-binding protein [Aurantimonas endophytica]|uniref:Peptide/nickel transport system ATP-binding protein n=1 Tax=Aurantimonas endophytica TaxID=1522175 RepID=A0A7W6HET4_9HYPH|nr:ABC transporter ATP-binding protein [Aurantimonas endophytica]MBB4003910.1 peptide/nickel transport system ATP-binding protein [Aurantimonas endophytica]MCO6404761.1 ATP-binding cassette domain-containing protein [Aurantimonas endophytica]